jgi:hypothetical protein
MEIINDCMAPHVKGARPDHMRIVWLDGGLRAENRVRVIAWTCDCREAVYELCRSAGQAYIRRTLRKDREVHETYRWTFKEAERVWSALLAGQAR